MRHRSEPERGGIPLFSAKPGRGLESRGCPFAKEKSPKKSGASAAFNLHPSLGNQIEVTSITRRELGNGYSGSTLPNMGRDHP
jgi:hypothetical protein